MSERGLTAEEIRRERAFITKEEKRIAGRPLSWREKERLRSATYEEWREKEAEKEATPIARPEWQKQDRYTGPTQVRSVEKDGTTTVCLERKILRIYQDAETKKKIHSEEFMSEPKCRDIYAGQKRCIMDTDKNGDVCDIVKATFACVNDLTVPEVAASQELPREEVKGCVEEMETVGEVYRSGIVLGDARYTMRRDVQEAVKET